MRYRASIFLTSLLFSFTSLCPPGEPNPKPEILVTHTGKPFYFRFVPKLKTIKSKKVITAKMDYNHPELGHCSYQVVKDLNNSQFFGWCNTKKIARRKTVIFEIDPSCKKLPCSEHSVELGLNEHMNDIIAKIDEKHKAIIAKEKRNQG